jgi:hypothetical protein
MKIQSDSYNYNGAPKHVQYPHFWMHCKEELTKELDYVPNITQIMSEYNKYSPNYKFEYEQDAQLRRGINPTLSGLPIPDTYKEQQQVQKEEGLKSEWSPGDSKDIADYARARKKHKDIQDALHRNSPAFAKELDHARQKLIDKQIRTHQLQKELREMNKK